MATLYVRQTALGDVTGRIDYISNPKRQEALLAVYDGAASLLQGRYWAVLAQECRAAYEQYGRKNLKRVEGREFVLKLDNALLDRMAPKEIAATLCTEMEARLVRPCCVAVHYNGTRTNLHAHIIYSERELLQEPVVKVAQRALFFDEQGKRHYKKGEVLDTAGELRPGCRIVAKGEVYENRAFGPVDPRFSRRGWTAAFKTNEILPLLNGPLYGGAEVREYDPATGMLPQQHIGNRLLQAAPEKAESIRRYNRAVLHFNSLIEEGVIPHDVALEVQAEVQASRDKGTTLRGLLEQVAPGMDTLSEASQGRRDLSAIIGGAVQAQDRQKASAALWRRYRAIRDEAWEAFIEAQRADIRALRDLREQRRQLYILHSTIVGYDEHGRERYKMDSAKDLQRAGFFEKRDEIEGAMLPYEEHLKDLRAYQAVARVRQDVVRSLMLAGADEATIQTAMREYETDMRRLQEYTTFGIVDTEGRRLKAAQWSAEQARKRAELKIKRLTEERERCTLMDVAEKEYGHFVRTGEVLEHDLQVARAADRQSDAR